MTKYYGIKSGYPRIRRCFGRFTDFAVLVRPFTLLGAFVAGFCLDILFSRPSLSLLHSVLVGLVLAFLQAGGQVFNQSIREEIEIDKINGKTYRPTVDGRVSIEEGVFTSFIFLLSGISIAFALGDTYGLWAVVIAFFAIAYTSPPFRVKRYFLLNNVWQGVSRGLLPAIYVASSYEKYGLLPVFYGVMLAVWVTGAQTSKDFSDVRGDRVFKIETLPVRLGNEKALRVMTYIMAGGFVLLNLFILFEIFPVSFSVLNILAIPSALIVLTIKRNIRIQTFENNLGWVLWYSTLGLFYVVPIFLTFAA